MRVNVEEKEERKLWETSAAARCASVCECESSNRQRDLSITDGLADWAPDSQAGRAVR